MLSARKFALLGLLPGLAVAYANTQRPFAVGTETENRLINEDFGSFVKGILVNETIPGISVAVVRPDGKVELGAWGNRTEEGDALEANSLFTIASCSKAFVAASMGILIDDFATGNNVTALPSSLKTFDWETKVKALLPDEWKLEDEWATEKANVRDILSHVSGMPRHDYSYGPSDTAADLVARLRYLRAAFELRHTWSYNNQMFITGAYIISKYANMSYEQFVSERIFKPLNMTDSMYSPAQARKTERFSDSWTKFGRRIPTWFDEDTAAMGAGAGGVITTTADLVHWLRMLIHQGVDPETNTTIVSKSGFEAMTTASAIVVGTTAEDDRSIAAYGMGWLRNSYKGHDMIWHTGGIPGISTIVAFFPHAKLGLAVLANADEKAAANMRIATRILEDALKVPTDEKFVKIASQLHEGQRVAVSSHRPIPHTANVSLLDLAGTYADPGYGSVTLCAPDSSSFYCNEVFANFDAVDAVSSHPQKAAQLLAAWPRVWSTHARLTQRAESNTTFDINLSALFPKGYGANGTAFETSETGEGDAVVEFVVDGEGRVEGFGLFGSVPGTTDRERRGGSVQERAEAWFRRV